VRLNRSLFPADLLTLVPRKGTTVNGAKVSVLTADPAFKAASGDGVEPGDMADHDYLDVFVSDRENQWVNLSGPRSTMFHAMRPGTSMGLLVEWAGVNGDRLRGRVLITWSYDARRSGQRPRVFRGEHAEQVWEYMRNPGEALRAPVLRRGRPVHLLGAMDVHRRSQIEKVDGQMDPSNRPFASSLNIAGFRGFRDKQTLSLALPNGEPGSGLTIVVGANNTGKSTIWEAFDAIARKAKSDVSFSQGRRNRKSPNGIRLSLNRSDGSTYVVQSRNAETSETEARWFGNVGALLPELEIVAVPARRQFQASFGKNIIAQRDWMSSTPDYSRSQQRDQFTGRLFDLHNNPKKKLLFDHLMETVLGYRLDWKIDLSDGQYGSSYYLKVTTGEGIDHTSEGLGDGIVSLLFILNAMYDAEPSTLLVIDEPELSLHPQLVRRLGRALAESARTQQIVVFTHAPELVSWDDITAGAEIARVYKDGGDSKISQADRSTIAEITMARRGWRNPHTMGGDANEALFLDDGVIVVEGQEDAALLPRAFEELGIELNGSIWGWGSGGKDNVPRIVRLLRGLGFSRVAAVLDNNVPETLEELRSNYPDYLAVAIPASDIRDKPASTFAGVAGLLDQHGREVQSDLIGPAREVLTEVHEYFSTTSGRPETTAATS